MEISYGDDEEEDGPVWSPLKSEKQSSSIIAQIKPLFPLKTAINQRKDLKLEQEKRFHRQVRRLLEQKEALSGFADLQKTSTQLQLK